MRNIFFCENYSGEKFKIMLNSTVPSKKNVGGRPKSDLWNQLKGNNPKQQTISYCKHCPEEKGKIIHHGRVRDLNKHFDHCKNYRKYLR